ncbi:MAG TPA: tRNA (N(6)-L-threonylcarbamoyladenosine(37)-C(2))-methylthiotransferase MtaB [Bryobacteraceae bacterium]|nr:tRNA (N(6)-L-threonylcarbamoyladenosine(37)-C(2))-methylthiotransferase MtaB [Bryobacteraceae bacterium]
MSKFVVHNFGCRASQADGAAIASMLERSGYSAALENAPGSAQLVVLNTCTVTNAADTEVRQIVRRVHRENPDARIVVTGCYAQRAPEEIAQLPGVAMVVGNSHKSQIAELVSAPYHGQVHVGDIFAAQEFLLAPVEDAGADRSRPNLKIQDGCGNRCSFCVIPYVRGRSRSAPVQQVVERVRALSDRFPEVVLTGINLGRWGREPGFGMRLVELLRVLLNDTDLRRLRLSSVEPMDWSDDLLRLVADSTRIAKHIHIPLQSGSDTVLRRMHRRYRPRHYESRVRLAREWMPDAAIGADVMVGFPGETEAEFDETRDFIERLPFTYLHIFPYSERPGTPAADRADQVLESTRKARGRILKQLGQEKNLEFRRRFVGRALSAVTIENNRAVTENYLHVELARATPARQLIELEVGALTDGGLREKSPFPVLAGS